MDTLSSLFLHSSRQYSSLADAIFGDSVEQSQFASAISSRRMQTAKAITGTALDVDVELDDEDMEILTAEAGWHSSLELDNVLMRIMAEDERAFLPLLTGVFTAAHTGAAYASRGNDTPKQKMCLSCGAICEQWVCPICGNEKNWLTGVDVPENTEKTDPKADATEMQVSLPNLSFGDAAPEIPVLPRRWEVFFGGRENDIFKATGLTRPILS